MGAAAMDKIRCPICRKGDLWSSKSYCHDEPNGGYHYNHGLECDHCKIFITVDPHSTDSDKDGDGIYTRTVALVKHHLAEHAA